ncbi:CsbD family protein [Ramlibacter albus]|uniref:CsbD family protein n=1 Tax=Ramlibacter albus TaxID=2079448 RepID=A0A923S3L3_9BURK|nr:CsbD family protein [Ramlibacter albus]MBC5766565.1 CsbD family protein [Ramlibacter albus]
MNKDQVKGLTKEATGEVKEQVGKALGDTELRVKGHAKEFEGKAQKKLGDMKEVAREDMDDIERNPSNNQS